MNSTLKTQSDRFINIPGAINLRDFGGYFTSSGTKVAKGKLYRCGTMAEIDENHFEEFAALDIGRICDLRSEEEALNSPTPSGYPFHCRVHLPIWPGSSAQFQNQVLEDGNEPTESDFREFMINVTREIALEHMEVYAKLLDLLINTENGFLFHCSAGKDRTGFGAALILYALGVPKETILDDYLLSNQAIELVDRTKKRMLENRRESGLSEEIHEGILHVLSGVEAPYLTNTFEHIDKAFGSLDNYLDELDFGEKKRQEIRNQLLD